MSYSKDRVEKYLICYQCNISSVSVSEGAVRAKCWRCLQMSVEPPASLVKQDKNKNKIPRIRGWQFMAEYVDSEGNVFHKGIERPELKDTLSPTLKPERKRKTFQEKHEEEHTQQQRLIKRYKRKKKLK